MSDKVHDLGSGCIVCSSVRRPFPPGCDVLCLLAMLSTGFPLAEVVAGLCPMHRSEVQACKRALALATRA